MTRWKFLLTVLVLAACSSDGENPPARQDWGGVTFIPMTAERLPDLPTPRAGHALAWANGKLIAAGGHTTGFIPATDADIFSNGSWHSVKMLYPHDTPFCLPLKDGTIALGGGYSESFGIGRSYGVECYDPATDRFTPLPILDCKRAHANAVELSGGKCVVSGNWYGDDAVESMVPGDIFRTEKIPAVGRAYPYVLRSDIDNVLFFGGYDTRFGDAGALVERLDGEPFEEPLLKKWKPVYQETPLFSESCFTGDMSTGRFDYLVHAKDSSGRSAVLRITGAQFSLLETEVPLPEEGPWGPIDFNSFLFTHRPTETAWIHGSDSLGRSYLACLRYGDVSPDGRVPLSVFFTPSLGIQRYPASLLLQDGNFLVAGGTDGSNYEPSATVLLLHSGQAGPAGHGTASWVVGILAALLLAGAAIGALRRRNTQPETPREPVQTPLAERIESLMRDRQFFRHPDLSLTDIAMELGTNVTYISACINSQFGKSLPEYVASFRVAYARDLLRRYPEKTMADIAAESGFANEKSFFRTFKAHTGQTPGEFRGHP